MRVACLYFSRPQNISEVAEVFYRASPQIMCRGDRALFIEIAKCRGLYSEAAFLRRARVTLNRLGIEARISVADDVSTSLAFAFFRYADKNLLPVEALRFYADPLLKRPEEGERVNEMIGILRRLGLKTVGDFVRLSAKEVSSRFGPLGLTSLWRVLGVCPVVWETFVPSETVCERHEFDLERPVQNLEPVLFRLRAVLDRVHLRLRGRGRRLRRFTLDLRQEYARLPQERDYRVEVLIQLPYVSQKSIFQIAKEKIEAQVQSQPLRDRITDFTVTVTEDLPYFMLQKDLFDQKKEENGESFFQVASRLAAKLGERSVFFAQLHESFWPERSWRRVHDVVRDECSLAERANGSDSGSEVFKGEFRDLLPERPLRIFHEPIPIEVSGKTLRTSSFVDEMMAAADHEVVLSYWWESPLERIYFRTQTRAGRDLWVFRTKQGYYLHGVFD